MSDTIDTTTEHGVRAWLTAYAWAENTPRERDAVVACIMAQDGWRHIDAVADAFASAQESPGPQAMSDGTEFALSALYECHDGPHAPDCPNAQPCSAARTGAGYWTCDVRGGCGDCRSLALALDPPDRDQIARWDAERSGS